MSGRTESGPTTRFLTAQDLVDEGYAWQPIETAPKDGTPILIWDGEFIEHVAWYWVTRNKTVGWWAIQARGQDATTDDFGCKRDYCVDPDEETVTHWMPLP